MLRFLLWRLLGLLALLVGFAAVGWLLGGGPGRLLRAASARRATSETASPQRLLHWPHAVWHWAPFAGIRIVALLTVIVLVQALALLAIRWVARSRRSYVRMRLEPYRTDQASAEAVVRMHEALHKRLLLRWWRRVLLGQPSVSLEVHHQCGQRRRREPRLAGAELPGWCGADGRGGPAHGLSKLPPHGGGGDGAAAVADLSCD